MGSFLTISYTAAFFTATDPVLQLGELGTETDTGQFKIGDGVSAWSTLAYGYPNLNMPIVLAEQQAVSQTTNPSPIVVSNVATADMCQISVFMESNGLAEAGHTVICSLQWTGQISAHDVSAVLHLDAGEETVVMETFPVFSAVGSSIEVSFAYGGGAINDPYAYCVRIIEMPLRPA